MSSQSDKLKTKTIYRSISFLDAILYILLPGPIVMFYPLIVSMILQGNCTNHFTKIYLVLTCLLLNMFMLPVLIPMAIIIGSIVGSLMFPMLLGVYALIEISGSFGQEFPLYSCIKHFKDLVPKFNAEPDDYEMTEEYFDDLN